MDAQDSHHRFSTFLQHTALLVLVALSAGILWLAYGDWLFSRVAMHAA